MIDSPPRLRDYSKSRAILIGTWDYKWLRSVGAAANSFERMMSLLTGPLCGWPEEFLMRVRNEATPGTLPDRIVTTCEEATDVVFFYYVGHGQIDPHDKLCLGLPDSRPEPARRAHTSLSYEVVRDALINSRAKTKIVILDCCFAGLANFRANTLGTSVDTVVSADALLDMTAGTGAYTMAATTGYVTACTKMTQILRSLKRSSLNISLIS
jgi:hypothetical protein